MPSPLTAPLRTRPTGLLLLSLLCLALLGAGQTCHAKGTTGSTTTLTSDSPTTVPQGTAIVLTAVVGGISPGEGSVTFYDGSTALATVTPDINETTTTKVTPSAGPHSFTAGYSGYANTTGTINIRASTSGTIAEIVNHARPTVTIQTSATPASFGQAVTFTAVVTGPGTPTGTVQFQDGGSNKVFGMVTIDGTGTAAVSTSSLSVGTHTVYAAYEGDTYFDPRASSVRQVINKADTAVIISSSANPSTPGQPVIFSAAASSAGGNPTGRITLLDGSTVLGQATVAGDGSVSIAVPGLIAGAHGITAAYGGDGSFNHSTSPLLLQFVNTPVPPPAPILLTTDPALPVLSPAYLPAGSPDTALTISGRNFAPTAQVTVNGVLLDLSLIGSETATQVVVTVPAALLVNPGSLAVNVLNPGGVGSSTGPVNLNVLGAEDVTASVQVSFLGQRLDRATGQVLRAYRLTNVKARILPGPLSMALDNLTLATLSNAAGQTKYKRPVGSAYVTASTADLAPGQSVTVQIALAKTGVGTVSYVPRILAGLGAR